MGRWSQRTRAGGGASLNFMTAAVHDDPETMLVDYLNNVSATAFGLTQFSTVPSGAALLTISQQGAKRIQLTWDQDVSADTQINYQGTVPSLLTPQTLAVT